jgi:hypothetical protein
MGFIRWLLNLLFGGSSGAAHSRPLPNACHAVADRLDRCADRFANAGDKEAELDARDVAAEVRRMTDLRAAKRREVLFYRTRGLQDDGSPYKPHVGTTAGAVEYVRYGGTVRTGGSKGWRYHNPGYVRCSDRATAYGAVGCDGEFAIFPNEHVGRRAYIRTLRDDYPDARVEDAVRRQLPPAEAEAVLTNLGVNPTATVGELTEADCQALAAAAEAGAGEEYDRGSAPDWAGEVWDSPATGMMTGSATDDS